MERMTSSQLEIDLCIYDLESREVQGVPNGAEICAEQEQPPEVTAEDVHRLWLGLAAALIIETIAGLLFWLAWRHV